MKGTTRWASLGGLLVVVGVALALAGCDSVSSPTAPPQPAEGAVLAAELAAGDPGVGERPDSARPPVSEASKGAAEELMLRARAEVSGFLGQPLLGTAWVHVTGPPRTADLVSFVTGPPGPAGLPIAQVYTFANGDWLRIEGLVLLDPPPPPGPPPPGTYRLIATSTIVAGSGSFAGMTGELEMKNGVATVEAVPGGLFERAEWHLKGRVRPGG